MQLCKVVKSLILFTLIFVFCIQISAVEPISIPCVSKAVNPTYNLGLLVLIHPEIKRTVRVLAFRDRIVQVIKEMKELFEGSNQRGPTPVLLPKRSVSSMYLIKSIG